MVLKRALGTTEVEAKPYLRSTLSSPTELPPLVSGDLDIATLRLLADNIPTLCWIANGDGYIVWYNRHWHEYCGTTPEQMEGWGWQSVHDPAMLPKVMARWQSSIATGEPFEMTFPLRGADGIYRPFLTRINPVRNPHGRVARWFGVNTDISEQMAAEEALAEALRAQETLLYEVNHRVKNSLQIVISLLALQEKNAANNEVKTNLGEARTRIGVVASIHQNLYKSGAHTDLNVCQYLPELASEIVAAHAARHCIELVTQCSGDLTLSIKEAVPLALIVGELLTNCIKYAFPEPHSGTIRFKVAVEGATLQVQVEDNGVGLPENFDPKRSSGMGMRLIEVLAKQLRASFDYSSQEGGARFCLTMPVS